jgi:hypothetical protein
VELKEERLDKVKEGHRIPCLMLSALRSWQISAFGDGWRGARTTRPPRGWAAVGEELGRREDEPFSICVRAGWGGGQSLERGGADTMLEGGA